MSDHGLTRRSLLAVTASGAVMISVPACAPAPGLRDRERQVLLRMARLLYPHTSLPDTVYADVLKPVHASARNDAGLAKSIRTGLASLDAAASGNWMAAGPEDQIAALRKIESGDFFATVQNAVRAGLYQHQAVWTLIGYPGSSVENGGYIGRGFDDIDWLPED